MFDRSSDTAFRLADRVNGAATTSLLSALAQWTAAERLYNLSGDGRVSDLLVERFTWVDEVSVPYTLTLDTLTLDASVSPSELVGRRLTLVTTLADGTRQSRSGLVFEAEQLGADGGFQRLRLTVRPWLQLLAHESDSRAWEHKSIVEIIDSVLGSSGAAAHADWRWGEVSVSGEAESVASFLARFPNAGVHPLCCQYRETNLHFVQRLLAEHGLGWRVEDAQDARSGHRIVFFTDSARWPENRTSHADAAGIRFHASSAHTTQVQDAIQSFGGQRSLNPAVTTVLRWDYDSKSAVAGSAPTHHQFASSALQDMASWLERYEPLGATADGSHCTRAELEHLAVCRQQAHEYRNKAWLGRSTVRSLRAGECFRLANSPLDALRDQGLPSDTEFGVHAVHGLGINNLPKELSERLAKAIARSALPGASLDLDLFERDAGDAEAALSESLAHDPELLAQATATGYANRFEACRRAIPWRPMPQAQPTALGMQTAIVVGPRGNTRADGADELYADRLGRIRVQFHWQRAADADPREDNRKSCWVRVAQKWAGGGMGHQFLPRIGQEVLIQFIDDDIDRPICVGALYNGRGEAGLPSTPGGQPGSSDGTPYSLSHDHLASAQGNLTGGNSPAWHGGAQGIASPGANAQNNAAALSGIKSKEFGGDGFNQLVFDDTPGQLRVQLATTQYASQLNMGHLIHQADNHRGSYRGTGFELRTDAYGAIRATQGVLISSHGIRESDPAGDNAPGMALLKQATALADTFSQAAKTHQTTQLATSIGTTQAGQSALHDRLAPLKALHTAISGMVSQSALDNATSDAGRRTTQADPDKLPHSTDPIVTISAKAGLTTVAGQDIQWASADAISVQAGQDLQTAGGNQLRINTGQSIGVLAGAMQAGSGAKGTGLTLIAAQGPVQMQAQAGEAQLAANRLINIQTANAHIDWAAAKKITLTTSGGAQIVIEGGAITVQCPGKITVRAAQKSFVGPGTETYFLPSLPKTICVSCLLNSRASGSPFAFR